MPENAVAAGARTELKNAIVGKAKVFHAEVKKALDTSTSWAAERSNFQLGIAALGTAVIASGTSTSALILAGIVLITNDQIQKGRWT
ncbi:hypothetical protein [Halorhabdus rudnickae]|uniref:hypothetical protein n=1 Tax=Halorhabdus rudnickae TaxID=1775544 RepID=UPI001082D2F9|nr:hypothetical protein [Halorhabdus rudnickae]